MVSANENGSIGHSRSNSSAQGLAVVVSLCVIVGLMYYSYNYPYPSGHPPSWTSFALFWLRELVILGFALVVLVVIAFAWLRRLFHRLRGKA